MAANLNGAAGDVVALYLRGQSRRMLFLGLGLALVGAVLLAVEEDSRKHTVPIIAIVFGTAFAAWGLHRMINPGKPTYVLLPQGLFIHIPKVRDILVPWSEIRDIFTQDIDVTVSGIRVRRYGTFRGVTSLRISQDFYDREIHVDSMILRGPGWSNVFVSSQDGMSIALHHKALGVDATALRRAVEARWRAFGTPPPPAPA